ncbi:hypothetical protein WJX74_004096 [Apatococcus lobatus]|uniref:Uncharacterized protein n=1 Tax=Apatococcus lobatus TaxID=904363 RepID=A0AAW1RSI3_9CHLO
MTQEAAQKELESIGPTRDLVESLQDGQSIKVPLSSKAFLLGTVSDSSKFHLKLGSDHIVERDRAQTLRFLAQRAAQTEHLLHAAVQQQQQDVLEPSEQHPLSPANGAGLLGEVPEEQDAALMGPSFLSHTSKAPLPAGQEISAIPAAAQAPSAPSIQSLAPPQGKQDADRHADQASQMAADAVAGAAAAEAALWDAWEQEEAETEAAASLGGNHSSSAAEVSNRMAEIFKQMSTRAAFPEAEPSHAQASVDSFSQSPSTLDLSASCLPIPTDMTPNDRRPHRPKGILKQSSKLDSSTGKVSTAKPDDSMPSNAHSKKMSAWSNIAAGNPSIAIAAELVSSAAALSDSQTSARPSQGASKPKQGLRRGFFGRFPEKAAMLPATRAKMSRESANQVEPSPAVSHPSAKPTSSRASQDLTSASSPSQTNQGRPPPANPSPLPAGAMPQISPAGASETAAAAFSGTIVERPAAAPSRGDRLAARPVEKSFEELVHEFHTGQLDNDEIPSSGSQGTVHPPSQQVRQPSQQASHHDMLSSTKQRLARAATASRAAETQLASATKGGRQHSADQEELPAPKVSRFKQRRAAGIQI